MGWGKHTLTQVLNTQFWSKPQFMSAGGGVMWNRKAWGLGGPGGTLASLVSPHNHLGRWQP